MAVRPARRRGWRDGRTKVGPAHIWAHPCTNPAPGLGSALLCTSALASALHHLIRTGTGLTSNQKHNTHRASPGADVEESRRRCGQVWGRCRWHFVLPVPVGRRTVEDANVGLIGGAGGTMDANGQLPLRWIVGAVLIVGIFALYVCQLRASR